MTPVVARHAEAISALCRRHGVRRLDLFGSAARGGDFDPARSDIDLLVEYEPDHMPPSLADFLALRGELEALFGRRVDLAMSSAIRNPYLRAEIDTERETLFFDRRFTQAVAELQ